MAVSELLRTDLHLAGLSGEVVEREDCFVVRTPSNPGFYYGNFLVLKSEPRALAPWVARFEQELGPELLHRCLAWSGEPAGEALLAEARAAGFEPDGSVEMVLEELDPSDAAWNVRPLDLACEWDAVERLNRECDATEQAGDPDYVAFKQRWRATFAGWVARGAATWWGAFDGERLVGQCGMVPCGELGRFQAVETDPEYRRRGVCSALVSAVARDARERLGLRRLLLAAELDGPALGLYRRLGFRETGRTHSLLRRDAPRVVRFELPSDHAGVRSLVDAAFGGPAESRLVEALRGEPGTLSLVCEHTSSLLGHVLFSRIELEGRGSTTRACALAPLAVRPAAQRRGVGSELTRRGLELAREAGYELCFVIGDPEYYGRFGFVPAAPLGFTQPFDLDDRYFQVAELGAGALARGGGRLVYGEAFGAL